MKDNIRPDHYRKGEIDLYEAFSQIFPHNEYRAGMQMIAMRYMFRDKIDRVEDLNKAMETLERLKEKEIEHYDNKDLGLLRALQRSGYKYLTRNRRGDFRAHIYFPYRIGNFWVSLGYFDIGYNINLIQVEWTNNKPAKIANLLETYKNGGEYGERR